MKARNTFGLLIVLVLLFVSLWLIDNVVMANNWLFYATALPSCDTATVSWEVVNNTITQGRIRIYEVGRYQTRGKKVSEFTLNGGQKRVVRLKTNRPLYSDVYMEFLLKGKGTERGYTQAAYFWAKAGC